MAHKYLPVLLAFALAGCTHLSDKDACEIAQRGLKEKFADGKAEVLSEKYGAAFGECTDFLTDGDSAQITVHSTFIVTPTSGPSVKHKRAWPLELHRYDQGWRVVENWNYRDEGEESVPRREVVLQGGGGEGN